MLEGVREDRLQQSKDDARDVLHTVAPNLVRHADAMQAE